MEEETVRKREHAMNSESVNLLVTLDENYLTQLAEMCARKEGKGASD